MIVGATKVGKTPDSEELEEKAQFEEEGMDIFLPVVIAIAILLVLMIIIVSIALRKDKNEVAPQPLYPQFQQNPYGSIGPSPQTDQTLPGIYQINQLPQRQIQEQEFLQTAQPQLNPVSNNIDRSLYDENLQ
jgi:hypothetical protein